MRSNASYDESDLPALRVMEKNAVTRSMREARERREELARVLHRVENIYGQFERPIFINREFSSVSNAFLGGRSNDNSNVEYVADLPALEDLLSSRQSRQKYLQQVTVFVVGYSKVASDRLRLIQEVNQFFINNEDLFDQFINRDDKILNEKSDSIDHGAEFIDNAEEEEQTVSELSASMHQAIESCQILTNRLGELNNNIIDCFVKYVHNKTTNKGKKKLEKALESAMSECNKLNEKLKETQKALSEKDAKIDNLLKQFESKTKEAQKYKSAAESIKQAALEADKLKELLHLRDQKIIQLESELEKTRTKIEEVKAVDAAQRAATEEAAKLLEEKTKELQKVIDNQKIDFEEAKREDDEEDELKRQHAAELSRLQLEYEESLQRIKLEHQQEIQQLKSSEFDENAAWHISDSDDLQRKTPTHSSDNASKNESANRRKSVTSKSPPRAASGSNQNTSRSSERDVLVFSDVPDLDDEDFWSSVPRNHVIGRFAQYRQLSRVMMSNLQDELDLSKQDVERQIHSLKSQHQAHKRRWDSERRMLLEALSRTESEKREAQAYADSALEEVEHFVTLMKYNKFDSNYDLSNLSLVEGAIRIKEFLEKQNLYRDPLTQMLEELLRKCKEFEERSSVSLPKFTTMIDIHHERKEKLLAVETQTEESIQKLYDTEVDFGSLDEDRDILIPDEDNDDDGKRSVAVSASPSLFRIALIGSSGHFDEADLTRSGVQPADVEFPSDVVDIQDLTGMSIIQHPIVRNYLKSYDVVLTFKESLATCLEDIEKADVSDIVCLKDMKPVTIRSQNRIIPQVEEIGNSIEIILLKSLDVLERLLLPKKMNYFKLQKAKSRSLSPAKIKQIKEPQKDTDLLLSLNNQLGEIRQMKSQLKTIRTSFLSNIGFMNKAIVKLHQLFIKVVNQRNDQSDKTGAKTNRSELLSKQKLVLHDRGQISIMFSRKDLERNVQRMQEALLNRRFDRVLFEEAVQKMSEYTEIPAKRLLVLVKKYVHSQAMKKIADYVKRNGHFSKETFKLLDKMDTYSEKRQSQYDDIQDYFRSERILRAKAMIEVFDKIQNNCSIFLIQPVLSRRSRATIDGVIKESKCKDVVEKFMKNKINQNTTNSIRTINDTQVEESYSNGSVWKPTESTNREIDDISAYMESRLFEIDTNRMLLPLNNVSVLYSDIGIEGDEIPLPPQVAVRSYVAVAHPTLVDIQSFQFQSTPSDTIIDINAPSKSRLSKDLSKHTPLPPIISQRDEIQSIETLAVKKEEIIEN